ncbi:MAG: hypothetical protein NVS4B12_22060 [Ktedonobacteraceae bacterium]
MVLPPRVRRDARKGMHMVEGTVLSLKETLEAFFQKKYGPVSFHYHQFVPQGDNRAKVDFTVSGENSFRRRYVGSAIITNSHLSTEELVRLW